MTLDNDLDQRLRSAHRRQHQAIEAHLRSEGLDRPPVSSASDGAYSGRRWLMLSATAVTALVVATLSISVLSSRPDSVSTIDAVANESTVATATTPTAAITTSSTLRSTIIEDSTAGTVAGQATATSTASPSTAAPSTETSNSETTLATTAPTSTSESTPTSTSRDATSADSTVSPTSARPSMVCPSGFRAPLELATVEYLSTETGWNRKDDLIDEQDAQYYFNTWEPNYPGLVQVEMILPEPVLATDLRVAQDPINEVSGVIDAETAGLSIRFVLEGLGGWRVHDFDEPTLVERVTFTRSEASANIVEVMVCVGRP